MSCELSHKFISGSVSDAIDGNLGILVGTGPMTRVGAKSVNVSKQ